MSGYIYFIAAETLGAVKIGFTRSHPIARLKGLQTGCPAPLKLLAFVPGSEEEERRLHRCFSPLRIHGEWFRLEMKLFDFIGYLDAPQQRADRRSFHSAFGDIIEADCAPYPMSDDDERAYVSSADVVR